MEETHEPVVQPRKIRYRIACPVLLLMWIPVLLCPCLFVTLLVEKELTYSASDVPEHEYRIFFLDSPETRGFGLSLPSVKSGGTDEDNICIVTSVNYLMWEGESEPSRYCTCYEKIEGVWLDTLYGDENCQPFEFQPED